MRAVLVDGTAIFMVLKGFSLPPVSPVKLIVFKPIWFATSNALHIFDELPEINEDTGSHLNYPDLSTQEVFQ